MSICPCRRCPWCGTSHRAPGRPVKSNRCDRKYNMKAPKSNRCDGRAVSICPDDVHDAVQNAPCSWRSNMKGDKPFQHCVMDLTVCHGHRVRRGSLRCTPLTSAVRSELTVHMRCTMRCTVRACVLLLLLLRQPALLQMHVLLLLHQALLSLQLLLHQHVLLPMHLLAAAKPSTAAHTRAAVAAPSIAADTAVCCCFI